MKMHKQINYRGYQFDINIFINRNIHKKISHRVICLGLNYGSMPNTSTQDIEKVVEKEKELFRKYIDELEGETHDICGRLIDLGFIWES